MFERRAFLGMVALAQREPPRPTSEDRGPIWGPSKDEILKEWWKAHNEGDAELERYWQNLYYEREEMQNAPTLTKPTSPPAGPVYPVTYPWGPGYDPVPPPYREGSSYTYPWSPATPPPPPVPTPSTPFRTQNIPEGASDPVRSPVSSLDTWNRDPAECSPPMVSDGAGGCVPGVETGGYYGGGYGGGYGGYGGWGGGLVNFGGGGGGMTAFSMSMSGRRIPTVPLRRL